MGSFAKSLAGILFGWVSDVFSGVWALLTTDSGTESIPWFGRQWILIVIILCVLGLIIDFVVYLYRWKPYRVWADFFKRLRREKQVDEDCTEYAEQETVEEAAEDKNGVYSIDEQSGINYQWTEPGKAVYDTQNGFDTAAEKESDYVTSPPEEPDPFAKYRRPGAVVPAENKSPVVTNDDRWQIRSETENIRRNERRGQNADEPRKRRIVRTLLGEDELDEFELSASSRPAPVINLEDAYHEPVYPPQWKHNKRSGDTDIHDEGSV